MTVRTSKLCSLSSLLFISCFVWSCLLFFSPTPIKADLNLTWSGWIEKIPGIVGQEDIVLRNFQITQGYFEMGLMFQDLIGAPSQINWPQVAVWASNSVGMSIRKETLNDLLQEWLQNYLPSWVISALKEFPQIIDDITNQLLEQTAVSLAGGNGYVFNQVGGAVATFGQTFDGVTDPEEARALLTPFLQSVNQSLDFLILSLESYWLAKYDFVTPTNQSQLLYNANLLIGYQEQWLLQKYLVGAFPGNVTITIPLLHDNFTLDPAPLVTQMIMSLVLSNEVLWVGSDVPPFEGQDFPSPALNPLTYPPLEALYLKLVGQTTSLQGTAAQNWADFFQRMRYVGPLFRSRQMDQYLWACPPFSPAQVVQIWADEKPDYDDLCLATCCENM